MVSALEKAARYLLAELALTQAATLNAAISHFSAAFKLLNRYLNM